MISQPLDLKASYLAFELKNSRAWGGKKLIFANEAF